MMKRIHSLLIVLLFFNASLFADQGGNDNFGYMWTDSNSPNDTVEYDWFDAFDGIMIFGNNDDNLVVGPISLPFDFIFYGDTLDAVYVSTEGFISFSYGVCDSFKEECWGFYEFSFSVT